MSTSSTDRVALPLVLLAAAGFLSSAGARIVDPLLHPIATDFRVAVPDLWIIIAAFTLPYGLNQLVLGPVGDRFGKMRVILGSLMGYAVFTAACAFATDLTTLSLLRALAGAASAGLIPVGMAYIGDAVPYDQRQVVLSKFLTGIVLAQILAGPVGGIFGEYLGWRGVFLVLAGLAVAVSLAFALRIRGMPDRTSPGRMFRPENYVRMASHRTGRLILLAAALDGAFLVGCFPFIAPYLHERFGLNYANVGLILACFGLGAWAYTLSARPLLARLGEGGMVLVGGLLMAGAVAGAAMGGRWWVFIPIELALGLGFFMLHGVLQARATEMLPQARATAVATFACLLFLGQSGGALLMGASIARFGYPGALLIDAACIAGLTLWLSAILRRGPA
ncbi:MAG: MFS transporter [Gemmatimonadaceae bacterium]|nr:MFS transporter [Acetobacteraceae bacterium]